MTHMSLHERIRTDIERRILSGELAPGDRLPVELDLVAQYQCARMTVNKALSSLAQAGLIERRKKAGSFVAAPKLHAMILDIPDLQLEVEAQGGRYGFRLLEQSQIPPDRKNPDEIELARGGQLLRLLGVHYRDEQPLALETRLISLKTVPASLAADYSVTSPGTWLLKNIPWSEAETRISARVADQAVADTLGVAKGHACLVVQRRTWRGKEGVTLVTQIFDGSAYDLVARFSPGSRHES